MRHYLFFGFAFVTLLLIVATVHAADIVREYEGTPDELGNGWNIFEDHKIATTCLAHYVKHYAKMEDDVQHAHARVQERIRLVSDRDQVLRTLSVSAKAQSGGTTRSSITLPLIRPTHLRSPWPFTNWSLTLKSILGRRIPRVILRLIP